MLNWSKRSDLLFFLFQPYSFEMYKSKEDKIKLLDETVKFHDGNAIIAVSMPSSNIMNELIYKYDQSGRLC